MPEGGIDNLKWDLKPWWITGFTDGVGCFSISIVRNKACKSGWEIKLSFSLHKKDKVLLEKIQSYFSVCRISTKYGQQTIKYYVQSMKDLTIIINHFNKYSLISKKQADYLLFKKAFDLILKKKSI